ncbi:hypothetical protein ACFLZV_04745 [Candidatus Margulisiibacteriota bacterium]
MKNKAFLTLLTFFILNIILLSALFLSKGVKSFDASDLIALISLTAVLSGAAFAFANKYFFNPKVNYVDLICGYVKSWGIQEIKVEITSGKISKVFCIHNIDGKCQLEHNPEVKRKKGDPCYLLLNETES